MAKKSKRKIPKQIAGLKVPKALRRELNGALASKRGRELIAGALATAGAGLAAKKLSGSSTVRRKTAGLREDALLKAGAVGSGGSALAFALNEASRTFADAFQRGKAEADARAAWPEKPEEAQPEGKAGRKSGRDEGAPAH